MYCLFINAYWFDSLKGGMYYFAILLNYSCTLNGGYTLNLQ